MQKITNTHLLIIFGVLSLSALAVIIIPEKLFSQSTIQVANTQIYTPTSTPAIPDINTVSALSYMVTKSDGTIVLSKNIDQQFPIASLTKLMTGIVTLERSRLGKVVTVSERAVTAFGDSGDLKAGDRITIETLLFPLFMRSSNDAAEVISESLGVKNSRATFIYYMNQKAKTLKLTQTKYVDPSGLSVKNVSTARNLETLFRYIEKRYPILLTITSLKEYVAGKYIWANSSSLSVMQGYFGGKTGFTTPAQQTAAAIFLTKTSKTTIEPLRYIILYSSNRNVDIELLRRYIEYQAELRS